jgi:hypothetical protein
MLSYTVPPHVVALSRTLCTTPIQLGPVAVCTALRRESHCPSPYGRAVQDTIHHPHTARTSRRVYSPRKCVTLSLPIWSHCPGHHTPPPYSSDQSPCVQPSKVRHTVPPHVVALSRTAYITPIQLGPVAVCTALTRER